MNPRAVKCSVCTGDARTRDLINRGIVDGISRRDLEDRTGISKSSIQRHKDNCLKYELQPVDAPIIGELVDENAPKANLAIPSSAAMVVRNRKLGTIEGLNEYGYGKIEGFDRMARRAEADGNLRVAGDLDQKAWDTSWKIGSLSGITKEAPTNDNRSVNVFTGMKPDEIRSILKALSAPRDTPTIEEQA